MMTVLGVLFFWCFGLGAICAAESLNVKEAARGPYSLAGTWHLRLDPDNRGDAENWAGQSLCDLKIHLPGTLDEAGIGTPTTGSDYGMLTRVHRYIGKAWYQREIDIPDNWRERDIELRLGRVLWESRVWVDGRSVGAPQDSLGTPHVHNLGKITPGKHILTLCIDNAMIHPIGDKGHAYTEATQIIWNGVIGEISLRPRGPVAATLIRTFPDSGNKTVEVEATLVHNSGTAQQVSLQFSVRRKNDGVVISQASKDISILAGENVVKTQVPLSEAQPWSEFAQPLYILETRIRSSDGVDSPRDHVFGFRTLGRQGPHLTVNGIPTFIRGNLDCVHFPLTGYPPDDIDVWRRIFKIYREHGLNQVRFHSWCPPEAAFSAADELGIYIQAEVLWIDYWMSSKGRLGMDTLGYPQGVGKGDRTIDAYVQAEARRMFDAYGNHPSFCFFNIGNELGNSNFEVMNEWIGKWKQYDPRILYAASSARAIMANDDFQDTHNIPGVGGTVNTSGRPDTNWDYEKSYSRAPVPVIAHELGQMPVYPNWNEIAKYTGVVRARNLEEFRELAVRSGVAEQSADFQAASGRMNRLIYKEGIEALFRTPSCTGFSLLSMQDYSGQGEALIGWLDSFYDSKGFLTAEEFRRYCNTTVPLARFSKYSWTEDETFSATIEVAHYGEKPLVGASPQWRIYDTAGKVFFEGKLPAVTLGLGSVTRLGEVRVPLAKLGTPARRLALEVRLAGTEFVNDWNIWVFPQQVTEDVPDGLVLTDDGGVALQALQQGKPVLFDAHRHGKGGERYARFKPLFWSASFFPGQQTETLGALIQNRHRALAKFPTDSALDWQWQELCRDAHGFLLNDLPKDYRPIIQPVHDFHYGGKLGSLFEVRVGKGRLLVSGYDITTNLETRPAARQLRSSLVAYASSPQFLPATSLEESAFRKIFPPPPVPAEIVQPAGFEKAALYV
ncbi:MAG: hypothetical protein LBV12_10990 [Puniceicoccales bacterium]|nr:hypothetical protein [Puniceicoccales bacterium]